MRNKSESPRDYLLRILNEGKEAMIVFGPELNSAYDSRILQAQNNVVTEIDFLEWLKLHLDYYSQKDREYGQYISGLIATFSS